MVLYSYIGLGLAVANICMILILLSIYWKIIPNGNLSTPLAFWCLEYFSYYKIFYLSTTLLHHQDHHTPPMESPHQIPLLLINSSQLVALASLLKISWK